MQFITPKEESHNQHYIISPFGRNEQGCKLFGQSQG